ncbi:SET domain-containing protein [Massarina eburnea CBS 473.64]|uniref:SET domain-containing protein n=1 Tax=Massarina eburnea CBS 473.64 TaxID=1395130 RepID=A0A6A6RW08_9PLEO|nr:SET domain-containing protein [Massarina eburnea CBS 473.64]
MSKTLPFTLLSFSWTVLASWPTCIVPITSTPYSYEVPSWLSLNYSCTGSPQVWEARPSRGKGIGVFATRPLDPGDIILAELPVIIIEPPLIRDGVAYPLTSVEPLLQAAFDTLSEEHKSAVLSLHAHLTPEEASDTETRLLPIFRSNAYLVGSLMSEFGLFPKGARINHSCRPNSNQVWIDKTGKRVVRAIRRIEEGEEISATYLPLLQSRKERQRALSQYGFKCTCSACVLGKAEQEASDKRRNDIRLAFHDFEPHLSLSVPQSVADKRKAQMNVEASMQLVKLLEEEELSDYLAPAYRIVALSFARIERWDQATIWAHKSYNLRLAENEDAEGTLEMAALTSQFISSWNEELYNKSKQQG